jgi:hypothetical protein
LSLALAEVERQSQKQTAEFLDGIFRDRGFSKQGASDRLFELKQQGASVSMKGLRLYADKPEEVVRLIADDSSSSCINSIASAAKKRSTRA